MSSAVVAWLALAAAVGIGAVLAVVYRRLTSLSREHTERKWELVVLRAELGDLRRRLRPAEEDLTAPRIPDQADRDGPPVAGRPTRRRAASPPAWRRAAGPPARPRPRRRPG